MHFKYSIIVPTRNCCKYLKFCLESILSQDFDDFEVIVSDNNSTDETAEYLRELKNSKLRIVSPPTTLSMSDNWEFALKHAVGEWIMFVGSDDGLVPYFFDLIEPLTQIAKKRNLKIINSKRAYYFANGCEEVYGDIAIDYSLTNKIKTKNNYFEVLQVFLGAVGFCGRPEMYTSGLFHKSIIGEVKQKQNGRYFMSIIPDFNSGGIAASLERNYLYCDVPLGWVGTSPKSNGMSSIRKTKEEQAQAIDFKKLNTNCSSQATWHKSAGDIYQNCNRISISSNIIYQWEAILQTNKLRSSTENKIFSSRLFLTVLFSSFVVCSKDENKYSVRYKAYLNGIIKTHKINKTLLKLLISIRINKLIIAIIFVPTKISSRFEKLFRGIIRYFSTKKVATKGLNVKYNDDNRDLSILDASNMVASNKSIMKIINDYIYILNSQE